MSQYCLTYYVSTSSHCVQDIVSMHNMVVIKSVMKTVDRYNGY